MSSISMALVAAGVVTPAQALLSDVKVGRRGALAALRAAIEAALAEGRIDEYVELRKGLPYNLHRLH